jgi:DNA repair exonuclease SbcCD ATPase subunit
MASQLLRELGVETQDDLDRQAITAMLPEFGILTASDRGRLDQQRLDTIARLRSLGDEGQRLERELHVNGTTLDEAVCVAGVERLELRKAICQRAAPIVERVRDNILQAVLPSTLDYMRAMLPLLTAGRYHDAELDEETYRIRVWDAQVHEYVEKDIYSGATQDQFSLALRLGFALAALPQERGARPGFIFLDEPTAGFDAQRRGALVELLTRGELAERFDQIFLVAPDGAFPENPFPHYVRLAEGQMVAENLSQRTGM